MIKGQGSKGWKGAKGEDNDEAILHEFHRIKEIVMDAGYVRYEISNFCTRGTSSIHNGVYRQMEDYLGL